MALPDAWRFVLLRGADVRGLAGANETSAIRTIAAGGCGRYGRIMGHNYARRFFRRLSARIADRLAKRFIDSVGWQVSVLPRYKADRSRAWKLSGWWKRFANLASRASASRRGGRRCLPVTECDEDARRLEQRVRNWSGGNAYEISIARPNNSGAVVEEMPG